MYPPQSLRGRIWRGLMFVFHRPPIHPGWAHPMRFYEFGCILCRWQFRRVAAVLPTFPDQSVASETPPEYDEDGNLVRMGVHIPVSVQRQLDEIVAADPKNAELVKKAIDQIAKNP